LPKHRATTQRSIPAAAALGLSVAEVDLGDNDSVIPKAEGEASLAQPCVAPR